MKKLTLTFKGLDNWDRPVYEANGNLCVDVNPYKNRKPNICTKYNNEFDSEPDMPIREQLEFEFVPKRVTWD